MDITGKRIILASGSPRRRELLSGLDIEFEVDTLNYFEERYSPDTPHELIPVQMSEGKSSASCQAGLMKWSLLSQYATADGTRLFLTRPQ